MTEEKEQREKQLERVTRAYRQKMKMVSNIYDQIKERQYWIRTLDEDINDCLTLMGELK